MSHDLAEIQVEGEYHSPLRRGLGENFLVGHALEALVTEVNHVVSAAAEPLDDTQ